MPLIKWILAVSFGTLCLVFSPATIYGQRLEENAGSKPKQGAKAAVESPPVPAVEYDPHSWKEFADERAMFSIMFPGTPVEGDNFSDKISGRKFTLKTSAFYFVGYQDLSLGHPKNNQESKQLDSPPGLAKDFLNSCLARYKQKDWDRAIADCSKAIELDPQLRDSYLMRGLILRDAKGNLDGAIADFDKALKVDPTLAEAYRLRAWAKYKQNDLDGAIADLSLVIEKDPSAGSYHERGLLRLAKNDLDKAIDDFNVSVEKSPGLISSYELRAKAKFMKKDFGGSIADFGMVIKLDPKSSNAHLGRGLALLSIGKDMEAQKDFDKFLELAPNKKADLEESIARVKRQRGVN